MLLGLGSATAVLTCVHQADLGKNFHIEAFVNVSTLTSLLLQIRARPPAVNCWDGVRHWNLMSSVMPAEFGAVECWSSEVDARHVKHDVQKNVASQWEVHVMIGAS